MASGLDSHPHADSLFLQLPVKPLGFSVAMVQSQFLAFCGLRIYIRDWLYARVIITSNNQHVRLLSPEPWLVASKFTRLPKEPDIVMKSGATHPYGLDTCSVNSDYYATTNRASWLSMLSFHRRR